MFAGVVEEIGEDPLQAARVGLDAQVPGTDRHGRVRQPRGRHRRDQTPDIDGFERDLLGARVEPGDLHQVVHERSQPGDVPDEQFPGPPALVRERTEVVAQDRGLGDQRRQRRPQFVRDVRHEPAVLGLGGLEPPDRLGQRGGHPVEPLRPRPELIVRGDRDPRRQVAASMRSAARLAASTGASTPRATLRATTSATRMSATVPTIRASRSWSSVDWSVARVVDEVHGGPARRSRSTDDEARLAADRRPGVGQLAGGDRCREVGRQRVHHHLGFAERAVGDRCTSAPRGR